MWLFQLFLKDSGILVMAIPRLRSRWVRNKPWGTPKAPWVPKHPALKRFRWRQEEEEISKVGSVERPEVLLAMAMVKRSISVSF